MNGRQGLGPDCTFSVSHEVDGWQVTRDAAPLGGHFHSRGDAIRAACFKARQEEKFGSDARVLAQPGDIIMPHYEPHFGL